jgi:hypothetical protein
MPLKKADVFTQQAASALAALNGAGTAVIGWRALKRH